MAARMIPYGRNGRRSSNGDEDDSLPPNGNPNSRAIIRIPGMPARRSGPDSDGNMNSTNALGYSLAVWCSTCKYAITVKGYCVHDLLVIRTNSKNGKHRTPRVFEKAESAGGRIQTGDTNERTSPGYIRPPFPPSVLIPIPTARPTLLEHSEWLPSPTEPDESLTNDNTLSREDADANRRMDPNTE